MSSIDRTISNSIANRAVEPELDWDRIHARIIQILGALGQKVSLEIPGVRCHPHQSLTHLLLFSFYMFEVPTDRAINPVVAGVDFKRDPTGTGLIVRADLVSEETGHIWYESEERRISWSESAALQTGEELARVLTQHGDLVLQSLAHPAFRPDSSLSPGMPPVSLT